MGKTTKRNLCPRRLAAALLTGAITGGAEPALAQELQQISSDERIAFDIAAQPLSSALSEFARQARLNALYFSDGLGGLSAPTLRGAYTRQQALDLLLDRTGHSGRIDGRNFILVQEQSSRPQRDSAATGAAERAQAAASVESERPQLDPSDEEIIVTGTSIRGAVPAGSNLITLDRDDIDQSGRTSVAALLQTLPAASPVIPNEMTQVNSPLLVQNIAFGTGVDLRGLGADATLTLVNGRRMAAAAAGNFVDISGIPLAAVDRIEVLADGASATYGTDAVGGVVNIILRRDFSGAETRAHYGAATQGGVEDYGIAQVLGGAWDRGSLVGAYEYRQRGELTKADRAFSASTDLTPFGGTDWSSPRSNPGTIFQIGANDVELGIPFNQDGTQLSEADLLPGVVNLQNDSEGAWLLPRQQTHSVFLSGRYELSANLGVFFDGLAAIRSARFDDVQLGSTITVPESNAYRQLNNLFPGQGPLRIGYNFGDDLGPIHYDTDSREHSLIVGADYEFANSWRVEASAAHSRHVDEVGFTNARDTSAIAAALASSDLATAFNPFADGSNTNASVLAGLTRRQDTENDSNVAVFALKADGPLLTLPGGPMRAAFGIERREDDFSFERISTSAAGLVTFETAPAPGERSTNAVYAEILAPLIGAEQNVPLINTLVLSASLRHEDSSDYGATTNPKLGLNWALTPQIMVHASWGTSFKAPLFFQLLTGSAAFYADNPAAFDPYATGASTGVLQLGGGNPNLEPERAESWTAGISVDPNWLAGLHADATYFDIDFSGRVAAPGSIFDAFQSPVSIAGYFIRNPTQAQIDAALAAVPGPVSGVAPADGVEAIFDGRLTNLSNQRVRGVDLSLSYDLPRTAWGEISLNASATGLLQFSTQINPAAPPLDGLNTIFNQIDWRGRASINWRQQAWSAGLAVNYANAYENNFAVPSQSIDAAITADARLAYRWGGDSDDGSTELALSVQNLTDEDPPFVDNPVGIGFDSTNASPVGRFINLELVRRW